MAFGCMVGWAVFATPGNTFLPVAGPAGTVIALAAVLLMGIAFIAVACLPRHGRLRRHPRHCLCRGCQGLP